MIDTMFAASLAHPHTSHVLPRLLAAWVVAFALGGCSLIDALQENPGGPGDGIDGPGTPGNPGDPDPPACSSPGGVGSLLVFDMSDPALNLEFEGAVQVLSHEASPGGGQLALNLENNAIVTLFYTLSEDVLPVQTGEVFNASIQTRTSFEADAVLVLRDTSAGVGSPGAVVAALWDTSDEFLLSLALPEISVVHLVPDCPTFDDLCGEARPLDLELSLPASGPAIRLAPGTSVDNIAVDDRSYLVANSASTREYVGQIACSDTPARRIAGHIVRR